MLPLYDMLANAQNGRGMELLARQFNLSQQQAQLAVEALMPAFSQGLKRNASDPYGVMGFVNALSSGQHAKYFDDAQNAFSQQGMAEGNGILGHLFGSKELSRAVAAQAAQATGIGQDILKQMLPVIASMLMGGLFKQSTGQMQGASASDNPLGQIIEQMMRQGGAMMGGGAAPQRSSPQADPMDNPFGRILEGMFGGGAAPQQQPSPQGQTPFGADNPFGRIFEEMMGGARRPTPADDARPPRQRAPEPEPDGRAKNPL
jgi:hypothetical protein